MRAKTAQGYIHNGTHAWSDTQETMRATVAAMHMRHRRRSATRAGRNSPPTTPKLARRGIGRNDLRSNLDGRSEPNDDDADESDGDSDDGAEGEWQWWSGTNVEL